MLTIRDEHSIVFPRYRREDDVAASAAPVVATLLATKAAPWLAQGTRPNWRLERAPHRRVIRGPGFVCFAVSVQRLEHGSIMNKWPSAQPCDPTRRDATRLDTPELVRI
jgi:hypothetical protein